MKVSYEEECWLCNGGPKQIKFKYRIYRRMDKDIIEWLHKTFKGYGVDYYYSNGKLWFRKAADEALFRLTWS